MEFNLTNDALFSFSRSVIAEGSVKEEDWGHGPGRGPPHGHGHRGEPQGKPRHAEIGNK